MKRRSGRRSIALLLAVFLLLSSVPVLAEQGTAAQIEIFNPSDLAALGGQNITGNIVLMDDISMDGIIFQPIASLTGTLEGNGYTISNLTIDVSGEDAGLIASLNGTVQNVVLENPRISISGGSDLGAAALVGRIEDSNATLNQCAVVGSGGSVTCTSSSSTAYSGSLVGYAVNSELTMGSCFSTVPVSGESYAGGLVGCIYGTQTEIENCFATGGVTAAGKYSGNAGGLVGLINGSNNLLQAKNCYFGGTVSGYQQYGFAYTSKYAKPEITVINCYYDQTKNKAQYSWDSFEVFPSSAAVTGTVTGAATEEFQNLASSLGTAFCDTEAYPALTWFSNLKKGQNCQATLTVFPENASISVIGDAGSFEPERTEGNLLTYSLPSGSYTAFVSPAKEDAEHIAQSFSFSVGKMGVVSQTFTLPVKTYQTVFHLSPATAELKLYRGTDDSGEQLIPEKDGSFLLSRGTYYYTVSDFGCITKADTVMVSEDNAVDISLEERDTTTVFFYVYPIASNAEIKVTRADGDQREMTAEGDGVYSLPEGAYQYTIQADGYQTKTGGFMVPGTNVFTITLAAGNSWDGSIANSLSAKNGAENCGTKENPYLIQNGSDLAFLAKEINDNIDSPYAKAYYEMTDDIDLGYLPWSPIGKTYACAFTGSFNGAGHTISGLQVSNENNNVFMYYGLFGCLTDARVENLIVKGEVYCGEKNAMVGGIAGCATGNTDFVNCANLATVSGIATDSIGGLAGLCRKSDEIGYQWIDNQVKFTGCYNGGIVYSVGEDTDPFSQGLAGGIAGYSQNCVQFENCYNIGMVTGANTAGGICGNTGSRQGDVCAPLFQNCYNAGKVTGYTGSYPVYGTGSIDQSGVVNCYALEDSASGENAYVFVKNTEEMCSAEFLRLLNGTGSRWTRQADVNDGLPYLAAVSVQQGANSLQAELSKYADIISVPANAEVGTVLSLLKQGQTANEKIWVSCIQPSESEQASSFLTRQSGGTVLLKQKNDTGKVVTETVTLLFVGDEGQVRKQVQVALAPEASSKETLMHKLAEIYASKTVLDEWAVFDMAAYEAMMKSQGIEDYARVSEQGKQNYINLAINQLNQSSALPIDRAKGEIILNSIGVDTTKLYPVNSTDSFDNAARLRAEKIGSDYSSAIWTLLADMQGQVELSESQIQQLVDVLDQTQHEDGLYHYTYGLYDFTDPDSTGWALAALSRFILAKEDSYRVKAQAERICQKAVNGLSEAQGSNGSYGNVYSDAMVITGLVALGIDPAEDDRFVKSGGSLADALMLYVNENQNGFTSAYASGEQGEELSAQATEQGFRGLVALTAFEYGGKQPYLIYAFSAEDQSASEAAGGKKPAHATGTGSVELPSDPPESADEISILVEIKALDEVWLKSSSFTVKEGVTVYQVLKQVFQQNGMTADGLEQGYIKSVTKDGVTFSQLDHGEGSGWIYYVNGTLPMVGIMDYKLQEHDRITLVYTADYTEEPGWQGPSGGSTEGETYCTIAFETNGGSLLDKVRVKKGELCAQPLPPVKEGYVFDGWFADQQLKIPYNFDETVVSDITLYAKWREEGQQPAEFLFSDVSERDWFFESVKAAYQNGLMKGISETKFGPDMAVTRGMFVTVLYRMEQQPIAGDLMFIDVPADAYYANAVAWANQQGIVAGISQQEFAPDQEITREQMAAILYRYAGYCELDMTLSSAVSFLDAEDISAYAKTAVDWCGTNGILFGNGDGTFAPGQGATRAEAAAVLVRMFEKIK